MKGPDLPAIAEYSHSRRQMKLAWDSFHRRAYRHTFIHGRQGLAHLIAAANLLGGADDRAEPLDLFFRVLGSRIPLDKAGCYDLVLGPPELKPLVKTGRDTMSDSVNDWLVARVITRTRAFEYLTLAQETVNLTIRAIEGTFPAFFDQVTL